MTIGSRLRQARERRGLTRQAFAQRCGFGAGTVDKYENDSRLPSVTALATMARELEVPVGDLMADMVVPADRSAMELPVDDLTRQRQLVQEFAAMLGGRVIFDGGASPATASEPVPDTDPADQLEGIAKAVARRGLRARSLPPILDAGQDALAELPSSDLETLARARSIDVSAVAVLEDDTITDAPMDAETALKGFLLCDALYGDAWRQADIAAFKSAGRYLSSEVLDGARAYHPQKSSWVWFDTTGDESDAEFLARLRTEISAQLVTEDPRHWPTLQRLLLNGRVEGKS